MGSGILRIMVSRHSAFYSPLISTIAADFLKAEGLDSTYQVLPHGGDAQELIRKDEVDIVQSAVSSSWARMEQRKGDLAAHFAQINQRDGFFIIGRRPDASFSWKKLEGATLLADHGGQPLAMLKYAAYCQGLDWSKICVIDAGTVEEIDAAFRAGKGDYVHQQGPAAQQIEEDGIGHVLAAVGEAMPPVAFSSLMASQEFLKSEAARAFMRAYRRARDWVKRSPPQEIAREQATFFPGITTQVLSNTIARYQALGCWNGDTAIPRELYEQALDVFLHCGAITRRHPYEDVVVPPPGPS